MILLKREYPSEILLFEWPSWPGECAEDIREVLSLLCFVLLCETFLGRLEGEIESEQELVDSQQEDK